jgi:hypothetical protein
MVPTRENDMTAGFGFEAKTPLGWQVLNSKLYASEATARRAAEAFQKGCAAEGWTTEVRVITVPALTF